MFECSLGSVFNACIVMVFTLCDLVKKEFNMSNCSWYESFNSRMKSMGLEAPQALFESYDKTVSTLAALVAAANIKPGVSAIAALSVAEVGAAGVLVSLAGLSAAAYAGVVAGSAIMAGVDSAVCSGVVSSVTPQNVGVFLRQNGIYGTGVIESEVLNNPRLMALS